MTLRASLHMAYFSFLTVMTPLGIVILPSQYSALQAAVGDTMQPARLGINQPTLLKWKACSTVCLRKQK